MRNMHFVRQWPILLLPVFFLLNAANTFYGDLTLYFFLRMGTYLFILTIAVTVICTFMDSDIERAFMTSLLLLAFICFAKNLYIVLQGLMNRTTYFIMALGVLTALILLLRKSGHAILHNLFRTSCFVLSALVLMETTLLAYRLATGYTNKELTFSHPPVLHKWDGLIKPDIYLLLFDEYQGNDGLKALFGESNHGFVNFLESHGFSVVESPRSNYNYTYFSVPSMFAMDYLSFSDSSYDLNYQRVLKSINTLNAGNHFTTFLKKNGYSIRNFSLFDVEGARTPYVFDGLDEDAYSVLYSRTLPGWLRTDLFNNLPGNFAHRLTQDLYQQFQGYNNSVYRDSREAVQHHGDGPVFVYSHFLLPHLPVLADSTGKARVIGEVARELHRDLPEMKTSYVDYTRYANRICMDITDRIIRQDPEAVILVVSDHGLRRKLGYKWVHDIQMAVRSPVPVKLYKGMTTVNLLRLVLNAIAGQRLPLLPDSSISVK